MYVHVSTLASDSVGNVASPGAGAGAGAGTGADAGAGGVRVRGQVRVRVLVPVPVLLLTLCLHFYCVCTALNAEHSYSEAVTMADRAVEIYKLQGHADSHSNSGMVTTLGKCSRINLKIVSTCLDICLFLCGLCNV
jgi:hypothetical protein